MQQMGVVKKLFILTFAVLLLTSFVHSTRDLDISFIYSTAEQTSISNGANDTQISLADCIDFNCSSTSHTHTSEDCCHHLSAFLRSDEFNQLKICNSSIWLGKSSFIKEAELKRLKKPPILKA